MHNTRKPSRRILTVFALAVIGLPAAAQTPAGPHHGFSMADVKARAQAGDAEAMLDLAGHLAYGDGKTAKPTVSPQAVAWLERAAATGDGEALYVLGAALRDGGYGVAADAGRSQTLIREAVAKGNGTAIYELAFAGVDGPNVPDTAPYPVPAADGVERLRWDLGMMDRVSSDRAIVATDEAIDRQSLAGFGAHITLWRLNFERQSLAAETGDRTAFNDLASDYLRGRGVAPDRAEAEYWFTRDAEHGDANTQLAMAGHYESGDFGPHRETMARTWYRRGAELLRPAATAGDAASQYQLGSLYENGKLGTAGADAQAFHWYTLAARSGYLDDEAGLSRLYFAGRGTARDVAAGLKWLTQAANNNGRRASDEDHADALSYYQQTLGELFYAGTTVPRDYAQALYWLDLAMDNTLGDIGEEAVTRNDGLEAKADDCRKHLTRAQADRIDSDVKSWHARFAPAS